MSEELTQRLAAAREAGLDVFDEPRFAFVERLLTRAETFEGAAAAALRGRARKRLLELEEAFGAAQEGANGELQRLADLGRDEEGALADALTRGDVGAVRRAGRRYPESEPTLRQKTEASLVDRLGRLADRRRSRPPEAPPTPTATRSSAPPASAAALELSEGLYRQSSANATAVRTLARAVDELPDDAGHYHGGTIAARTLEAMQVIGPGYLRAWLDRFAGLAAIEASLDPAREAQRRKAQKAKAKRRR